MSNEIIVKNFTKSASFYDDNANIQAECARKLASLYKGCKTNTILEIGCGTGLYTSILHNKFPEADIISLDISEAMIIKAKDKLSNKNIYFLIEDEKDMRVKRKFDLITSNAALQWVKDIESSFLRYSSMLEYDGTLTFSIYGPDTFNELEGILSDYSGLKGVISASKFLDMEDLRERLSKYFHKVDIQSVTYKARFLSLLDFLRNIKLSGARGYGLKNNLFIGKDMLKKLEVLYFKKYGSISASHNVFFAEAKGVKHE